MSGLRELQLAFVGEVFGEKGPGISDRICAAGSSGAERLQVYRNNVFVGFTKALRSVYPVIEQLVGEGFFRYAGAEFIKRHPSESGDLHGFGGAFPDFLSTFGPTANMNYLSDVARLEWAYHQVFFAASHGPLDVVSLGTVPQTCYEELKFQLHPASRLLTSPYPILRIWQLNQKDCAEEGTVDLAEGGIRLLLIRRELEIEIQPLEDGEFVLLQALADDLDFGTACNRALTAQADFDVASGFRKHIAQGTLVGFRL
jgi:hypothetical protein